MTRQRFLADLIRLLVEEWGHDEVQSAILNYYKPSPSAFKERPQRSARSAKPTAAEQVARLMPTIEANGDLMVIAHKFDRKEFLPHVSDVKHFLAMIGEDAGFVKDRSDAFRRLLRSLQQFGPDRLKEIATSTIHSGPARLGPLSDAIKAAGESLRRSDPASEAEQKP